MEQFGTLIERGRIISITGDKARVASTDRPGIVTMPLKPLFRKAMEVGWPVFFMDYEDGNGVIISHQNPEVTREEILQGPKGDNGKSITSAAFSGNDLIFILSDNSTVSILGAKTILTGPAGSDATVTKPAVELVLTGTITSHNHDSSYVKKAGDSMTGSLNIGDIEGTAQQYVRIYRYNSTTGMHGQAFLGLTSAANVLTLNVREEGVVSNQIALYGDKTELGKPLTVASGGTAGTTAAEARAGIGAYASTGGTISGNVSVMNPNTGQRTVISQFANVATLPTDFKFGGLDGRWSLTCRGSGEDYFAAFYSYESTKYTLKINTDGTLNVYGEVYAGTAGDKKVYHAGNITKGTAVPTGGTDGDIYFLTSTKKIYMRISGVWTIVCE